MIHREQLNLPSYVYPADEWRLVEKRFFPRLLPQTETFFALANGYLGFRGSFEEGRPVFQSGTFVNGFYESWPIVYGEEAYGFARTGQTIVNVTDAKTIRLYVDDEPFFLPTATLGGFERALNMREGTLDREIIWETPAGKRVSIKSRRLVSFEDRHLAAISYEVTVLNAAAPVAISSELVNEDTKEAEHDDPRRPSGFRGRVLMPKLDRADGLRIVLGHETKSSKMTLACGVDHVIETDCPCTHTMKCSGDAAKVVFSVEAKPGVPIRLTKFMSYHTSRSAPPEELCERAERCLDRAVAGGFDAVLSGQRAHMNEFWRRSDVELEGDPAAQQAVRFNLFQILQASGRAEGVGIPAKGLTGQGYEGHFFWDTEIYVLPFLIYNEPRVARNILKFRHSYLEKARARAREVNQRGALFPWRTINGEEASAYYAAGTAQYHINADIVYALKKYVDVTGDTEFLYDVGAEILVETARLWVDLGFYSEREGGKFCIHGVTGPDEYNTVVNNNTYTNLMARENLWYAARTVESLRHEGPERFEVLVDRTGLEVAEIAEWRRAADSMFVPFDEQTGVHPQDDSFLDKQPWDFDSTSSDKYPLLLHHHPLVIYRHRVIKQADIVLAMFLLGHEFSTEQKKRNFDFYDPMTTGDSSLSVSIQCIVAAELGYWEQAREYARSSALMDLADVGGNVQDGCHIASMGGTWMAVVYGLAGLRDWNGEIGFRPVPPPRAERIGFHLTIRGRLLRVEVSREAVTYTLREGDGLEFRHDEELIHLTADEPVCKRPHAPEKQK
jgi:alpha,alpha-trehalose phosphorylase